jgi:NADH:ubiquinone oxidoreductase subunit F (NADH-binding)
MTAVLTAPALQVGPDLSAYFASGGGAGLTHALRAPEAIIAEIATADLRGLGGAGFPTHRKWTAVAEQPGPGKWLICNGNEDEPGTFKDRFLLERTPHQVIEGALIAAIACRASSIALYVIASELASTVAAPSTRPHRPLPGSSAERLRSASRSPVRPFPASSCGQCPPCKVGTFQVARLLSRIVP